MAEFGDWQKSRVAKLRIAYTFERVGFHLWKNQNEIKTLAQELKIKYPYRLQELFYKPNGNQRIIDCIENLRSSLLQKFKNDKLKTMENRELLNFAFKNNPEVLRIRADYFEKNRKKRKATKHKHK